MLVGGPQRRDVRDGQAIFSKTQIICEFRFARLSRIYTSNFDFLSISGFDFSDLARHQRLREQLGHMLGMNRREMIDLMAATGAAGDHRGSIRLITNLLSKR